MKSRLLPWCVPLGTMALLLSASAGYPLPSPRPAGDSGFTADRGQFRILQQDTEAGTEDFSLEPAGNDWLVQDETVIHVPGNAEMRTSGQLRISRNGTPQHYTWSAQGDKKASGTVEFDAGTAKTSATIAGAKQPLLRDFRFGSPRVAVLDNNLYEQYAILGRLYDWDAKGKQSFPVLIPQDATPGSIDVESLGEKSVGNTTLQVLRVHSTDLEVEVYFDARLRLMRLEVPAARVVIVRQ